MHPPDASITIAMAHAGRAEWAQARSLLEQGLSQPETRYQAGFLLWEVCQVLADPIAAVGHLRSALEISPITSRPAEHPARRVLALAVPGDFQANLPLAMLLTEASTHLYTYWLHDVEAAIADPARLARTLPDDIDCVFVAIAEDARHIRALTAAAALADALALPVINVPARIAAASRDHVARMLQSVPDTIVPTQTLCARAEVLAAPVGYPLIIRPRHSHAGAALTRIADVAELFAYLQANPEESSFYLAPFIDYRNEDGRWRKYRVIFVDGHPWPFHMAVHDDWAVWYYNAGMDRDPTKQAEEARFLHNIEDVFPPAAMQALHTIAERIGLDYCGLDCGLLDDGTVVVFELETGMIVHDRNEDSVYEYKIAPARRILRAAEAMIDRRIAAFKR